MTIEFRAVTLDEYAEFIGYRDTAFYGIEHPLNARYACRELWEEYQRKAVERALLQAQQMIEDIIGYPLKPRWITDERWPINPRGQTRWMKVIEPGVMDDSVIAAGVIPNYATDPATITVNGVTCAVADIHLFRPGSDVEIIPSQIAVSGAGVLTASIPWARLKADAYLQQLVQYADVATWGLAAMDVRCLTTDDTTQVKLFGYNNCDCTGEEGTACMAVVNGRLGFVRIHSTTGSCGCWQWMEFNYKAGEQNLSTQAKEMVIRLAHSLMPDEPCGCAVTQRFWKRDRNVPDMLTRERLNCPFGMSDGAWAAWSFARNLKIWRSGVLA